MLPIEPLMTGFTQPPLTWIELVSDFVVLVILYIYPLVWLRRNTTRYKRVVWR